MTAYEREHRAQEENSRHLPAMLAHLVAEVHKKKGKPPRQTPGRQPEETPK